MPADKRRRAVRGFFILDVRPIGVGATMPARPVAMQARPAAPCACAAAVAASGSARTACGRGSGCAAAVAKVASCRADAVADVIDHHRRALGADAGYA
eukprot:93980-Chlamydomonas_euryale.AAC.1